MKSFVIYLTVFFVVTTYIRGFLGLDRYKFYENPYLVKLEKEKQSKKNHKINKFTQSKVKKYQLDKPVAMLDFSTVIGSNLLPIEEKYLDIGIKNNLAKEWFTKKPDENKFKVVISIKRHIVSSKRYVSTYEGKRHYIIEKKIKININYKVYNSKDLVVAKAFIPYNVLIKSVSKWDYLESERIAKKKLFLKIGQKIANSLNSKRFYILHRANISKL